MTSLAPPPPAPPTTALTAQDRCDRCSGQAHVLWSKDGLELILCAHHNRAHHAALASKGFEKSIDNLHLIK